MELTQFGVLVLLLALFIFMAWVGQLIGHLNGKMSEINRALNKIIGHLGIEEPGQRELNEELKRLLGEKRKIEAIRLYRKRTNAGLKEAHDYVEGLSREL